MDVKKVSNYDELLAALESGIDTATIDATGIILVKKDLSNRNLSGICLDRSIIHDCDFRNSNMCVVSLRWSSIMHSDFRGRNISNWGMSFVLKGNLETCVFM